MLYSEIIRSIDEILSYFKVITPSQVFASAYISTETRPFVPLNRKNKGRFLAPINPKRVLARMRPTQHLRLLALARSLHR